MKKRVGYARVARENKEQIERQISNLINNGVQRENIYIDIGSGLDKNRTELNRMLSDLKSGDILITEEPARLSRSYTHLMKVMSYCIDSNVEIIYTSI